MISPVESNGLKVWLTRNKQFECQEININKINLFPMDTPKPNKLLTPGLRPGPTDASHLSAVGFSTIEKPSAEA